MLLLTFTAGANRYAIDVDAGRRARAQGRASSIPHAPAFLAGLLGYRGNVVPVIDLGLLLRRRPVPGLSQHSHYPGQRRAR